MTHDGYLQTWARGEVTADFTALPLGEQHFHGAALVIADLMRHMHLPSGHAESTAQAVSQPLPDPGPANHEIQSHVAHIPNPTGHAPASARATPPPGVPSAAGPARTATVPAARVIRKLHMNWPSDGASCTDWRAWREIGDNPLESTLHVTVSCRMPADRVGALVVLEDAVLGTYDHVNWADLAGGEPVLVLERVIVPAAMANPDEGTKPPSPVVQIHFRREEHVDMRRSHLRDGLYGAGCVRHRYVAVLEDDVLIPVEEGGAVRPS